MRLRRAHCGRRPAKPDHLPGEGGTRSVPPPAPPSPRHVATRGAGRRGVWGAEAPPEPPTREGPAPPVLSRDESAAGRHAQLGGARRRRATTSSVTARVAPAAGAAEVRVLGLSSPPHSGQHGNVPIGSRVITHVGGTSATSSNGSSSSSNSIGTAAESTGSPAPGRGWDAAIRHVDRVPRAAHRRAVRRRCRRRAGGRRPDLPVGLRDRGAPAHGVPAGVHRRLPVEHRQLDAERRARRARLRPHRVAGLRRRAAVRPARAADAVLAGRRHARRHVRPTVAAHHRLRAAGRSSSLALAVVASAEDPSLRRAGRHRVPDRHGPGRVRSRPTAPCSPPSWATTTCPAPSR